MPSSDQTPQPWEPKERPPLGWTGADLVLWNKLLDGGCTIGEADEITSLLSGFVESLRAADAARLQQQEQELQRQKESEQAVIECAQSWVARAEKAEADNAALRAQVETLTRELAAPEVVSYLKERERANKAEASLAAQAQEIERRKENAMMSHDDRWCLCGFCLRSSDDIEANGHAEECCCAPGGRDSLDDQEDVSGCGERRDDVAGAGGVGTNEAGGRPAGPADRDEITQAEKVERLTEQRDEFFNELDAALEMVDALGGPPASEGCLSNRIRMFVQALQDKLAQLTKERDALKAEKEQARERSERAVVGALRSCIDAHGPITMELIGSATKRIVGALEPVS